MEAEYLRLLGRIAGASCQEYEACPTPWGVVNIDGYSMKESRYTFLTTSIWAWRSVMAATMDVVATGSRPRIITASLGVSSSEMLYEATLGVAWATRYIGATLGKLDSNKADQGMEWIDIAVIGEPTPNPIPTAPLKPVKSAHVIQIGYAGYGLVEKKLQGEPLWKVEPWLAKRKPPIEAWRALNKCQPLAAADNSDGYLYTLHVIARLGRLDIRVEKPPLTDPRLGHVGYGALDSWEDYNLLVIASDIEAECLHRELGALGLPYLRVGSARTGHGRVYTPVEAGESYERWLPP